MPRENGSVEYSFTIIDGVLVEYNGSADSIMIPDEVREIGPCAFKNTCIKSIQLPEGLTLIGAEAFRGCGFLTSITVPDSVEIIGSMAFAECGLLNSVKLPDRDVYYGEHIFKGCSGLTRDDGLIIAGDGVFGFCGKIYSYDGTRSSCSSITVPDGIEFIAPCAFEFADFRNRIRTVTLPKGLKRIDRWAFCGCESLYNINLPESLSFIGTGAFRGCISLLAVNIPENLDYLSRDAFEDCRNLWCVIAPDIACPQVNSVIDGAGYTVVKESSDILDLKYKDIKLYNNGSVYARSDFESPVFRLEKFVLKACPDILILNYLAPFVRELGENVFRYNESIKSIRLPEGLEKIGDGAFFHCVNLEYVFFPSTVRSIGDGAFMFCRSLKSVAIPEGVRQISRYAFHGCNNLMFVKLPDSLRLIDEHAFEDCGIISIELPYGLKRINFFAFNACTKLEEVKNLDDLKLEMSVFSGTPFSRVLANKARIARLRGFGLRLTITTGD